MTATTTSEETTVGVDLPLGQRIVCRALTSELIRLGRVDGPRAVHSAAAVAEGYEKAWQIADRWLPLAKERRRAASGSAADHARWDGLVRAVARPDQKVGNPSFTGLVELVGHTRELLRTLRNTEPSYVPVAEVAAQITEAVQNGTYLAGMSLSPGRIAADLGLPRASVQLALTDLAEENVVQLSGTGRARLWGPGHTDRAQQIADWLRELIAAGAYPPGTQLPTRPMLARSFISAEYHVAAAIRILTADGTLICHPGQRPVVRPGHPHVGTKATEISRTFNQLPCPATPMDPSDTGIREAARVAQSWWRARLSPHPATLDHHYTQLVAIARHLITRAGTRHNRPRAGDAGHWADVDPVIARITATAIGVAQAGPEHRVWRIACLAAAVLDLLKLTAEAGEATGPRPRHAFR
ncbi:GntR family transcriptional regulator [Streptomyces sioyaensis]|uniref:GntR family transcriptional regulator n=1 Tax=Streptomyces sioyaensis TaxID=67364 RepID=UPI003797C6E2